MTKTKKFLSLVLALLMVLSIVPLTELGALSSTASAATALAIPSGAKYYGGHMYYLYKNINITWTSAKKACEKKGGHLATITSSGENKFVLSFIGTKGIDNFWLGATDIKENGKWEWVTGEKWKFTDWVPGQPDGQYDDGQYYLATWNSHWGDYQNDNSNTYCEVHGYLCEWEVGKVTGIQQIKATSSSVVFTWKDNSKVSKYVIYYYNTSTKKYEKYDTVAKTSLTVSGLSSATSYKMGIAPVIKNNGKTQILKMTTFTVVTKPGTVKNLKIEDGVSLTWSAVKGATGYTIYSYDSSTKKWSVYKNVSKNNYNIGSKFGNKTQQFKVAAYLKSSDGTKFYGGFSNTVKR